jgi:ATP-dependent DNA helicase RecG
MTGPKVSEEGEQRLQAMLDTTDGFKIAEMDLELRGPGEFFGTKQAGMPSLRVANIVRDRELLEVAKKEAAALLANSNLEVPKPDLARAFGHLRSHWNRRYGLVEVG